MKETRKQIHSDLLKICNAFQDNLSKDIFICRLNYFLSRDICHLNKMSRLSKDISPDVWEKIRHSEIVLYGTGNLGGETLTAVRADGLQTILFCDSSPMKQGGIYLGLPVISPEELLEKYTDKYVLISTSIYYDEVFSSLVSKGFPQEQIITAGHFNDIYFGEDFLHASEHEVYLDVGCNNGDTIEQFLSFCKGKYKKIYGLEPDFTNHEKAVHYVNTTGLKNVELLNLGAWSEKTHLCFDSGKDTDSAIVDAGNTSINVNTIDRIIGDEDITFIKMDIEGAEMEALKGAASVIKRCKPKLAICVYHKPEDILEISDFLLELADYKLYLRHHNHYPFWRDTVLYAV